MNITKGDVQELRRRLKKKECTFDRMCGCYVNSGKQIVLKFTDMFSELEEDEYFKYLEIAKKTISGTLGSNLLELEFDRNEASDERRTYLLTLRDSRLANEELLDRLYEKVIEEYSYPGNYLILVYHDIYDVPSKATSGEEQEESEEIYEYLLCAVCPSIWPSLRSATRRTKTASARATATGWSACLTSALSIRRSPTAAVM